MKYNQVKSKKKNKLIIIVALVLSLVVAGGAIAGIGYAFNWFPGWGVEVNEENLDTVKEFPTSSTNLNVSSINDIIGVEFTPADFSAYVSFFENNATYYYTTLNVEGYGVDFELPEDGLYNLQFKLDGKLYETTQRFISSDDANMSFAILENGTICPFDPSSQGFSSYSFFFGPLSVPSLNYSLDSGYCIGGISLGVEPFETFELVAFEKISD